MKKYMNKYQKIYLTVFLLYAIVSTILISAELYFRLSDSFNLLANTKLFLFVAKWHNLILMSMVAYSIISTLIAHITLNKEIKSMVEKMEEMNQLYFDEVTQYLNNNKK